ncbi:MarR family winged helix-turn-helix transcriptional regulator [Streptomyces mangrovisoli]|uniref:MarR family transcriptional regulator n=1 Tax=Streptomyces mangrovisoli TaxID=1428628 RepID=A0A1J4NTC2_9ACTN|nr:MarR family transcriptional regulator [Streptomyces mangrovisoli]OIJ64366.1 MarR family transcriptional regulator [Streptomyces mangrovisoli]
MEPGEIAQALAEVAGIVVRSLADRRGMSFTAAATLGRLEREGPVRITALAAAEGVAQPSMTQLVQRLENQGLAARISDPDDGRVTLVAVTDAGREVLTELRHARKERLVQFMAALTEDERQALGSAVDTALPLVRRMVQEPARTGAGRAASRPA